MNNVVVVDQKKFELSKQRIKSAGKEHLLVVSDFDKTMTSCFVDGKKIASLISILRDEKYLTPDYPKRAQALYDKYHPIEVDEATPLEDKKRAMHEWWSRHYDLLIESGLSKDDLRKIVQSKRIALRPGALELLDLLNAQSIPLLILSSAGVGAETIALYLERFSKLNSNIKIASNAFVWDANGKVIGVAEPIIHTFNKDFTAVRQFDFYEQIRARKNVILLGDSLGDADMLNGFDYETVIKIGFLNEDSKGGLAAFKKQYDIVVLNDGSMDGVVDLFKHAFDVVIMNDGAMDFVNLLVKELITV